MKLLLVAMLVLSSYHYYKYFMFTVCKDSCGITSPSQFLIQFAWRSVKWLQQ